jgi:hypothetical protein
MRELNFFSFHCGENVTKGASFDSPISASDIRGAVYGALGSELFCLGP